MTDILDVTSSPRGDASYSNRVSARALDDIRHYRRNAAVVVRDLARDTLPHIDEDFLTATDPAGRAMTARRARTTRHAYRRIASGQPARDRRRDDQLRHSVDLEGVDRPHLPRQPDLQLRRRRCEGIRERQADDRRRGVRRHLFRCQKGRGLSIPLVGNALAFFGTEVVVVEVKGMVFEQAVADKSGADTVWQLHERCTQGFVA